MFSEIDFGFLKTCKIKKVEKHIVRLPIIHKKLFSKIEDILSFLLYEFIFKLVLLDEIY